MLAGELPAAVLAAQCENGGRASTGGYHSIPSQGHGQDASAADSPAAAAAREYAQGAPGTERPYGPETASGSAYSMMCSREADQEVNGRTVQVRVCVCTCACACVRECVCDAMLHTHT